MLRQQGEAGGGLVAEAGAGAGAECSSRGWSSRTKRKANKQTNKQPQTLPQCRGVASRRGGGRRRVSVRGCGWASTDATSGQNTQATQQSSRKKAEYETHPNPKSMRNDASFIARRKQGRRLSEREGRGDTLGRSVVRAIR